jgi:hypothetical protein
VNCPLTNRNPGSRVVAKLNKVPVQCRTSRICSILNPAIIATFVGCAVKPVLSLRSSEHDGFSFLHRLARSLGSRLHHHDVGTRHDLLAVLIENFCGEGHDTTPAFRRLAHLLHLEPGADGVADKDWGAIFPR